MSSPNLGSLSRQHLALPEQRGLAFDFWPRILNQGRPEFDRCKPSTRRTDRDQDGVAAFALLDRLKWKQERLLKRTKTKQTYDLYVLLPDLGLTW